MPPPARRHDGSCRWIAGVADYTSTRESGLPPGTTTETRRCDCWRAVFLRTGPASLSSTRCPTSDLGGASLRGANLSYAFLGGADLDGMVFHDADLSSASFYQTIMCDGSAPVQPQDGYNCSASG